MLTRAPFVLHAFRSPVPSVAYPGCAHQHDPGMRDEGKKIVLTRQTYYACVVNGFCYGTLFTR